MTANGARGEVVAVLAGAQRRLCLTLAALAEIETGLGRRFVRAGGADAGAVGAGPDGGAGGAVARRGRDGAGGRAGPGGMDDALRREYAARLGVNEKFFKPTGVS